MHEGVWIYDNSQHNNLKLSELYARPSATTTTTKKNNPSAHKNLNQITVIGVKRQGIYAMVQHRKDINKAWHNKYGMTHSIIPTYR